MPGDRELTTAGAILEAALQQRRPDARSSDRDSEDGASGVERAGEVESVVSSIFAAILGGEQPSREASFTSLGGDSLMAISILSRIWRAFDVKLTIRAVVPDGSVVSVSEEVRRVRSAGLSQVSPVSRRATDGEESVSANQAAVWFVSGRDAPPLYNIPYALRLNGPLDSGALKRSLNRLLRRHQALRTRFVLEADRLVQEPVDIADLDLGSADFSHLPRVAAERSAQGLADAHVRMPFDLEKPPLIRPLLIKLAEQDHLLVLVVHHIVCDAWSIKLMARDLAESYGSPLAEDAGASDLDFLDFAAWQRQMLEAEEGDRLVSHWREVLDPEPALLPTDCPGGEGDAHAGEIERIDLDAQLIGDLRRVAGDQGMTLYMILLSAYALSLSCRTGHRDIVVGSPVANREQESIEGVVGYVANTLPMRIDLTGDPTLRELLARVRTTALDAYEYQAVPFARLVRELAPVRHRGRNPIFQTGLVLNDMTPMPLAGLGASEVILHTGTSKLDLTCYLEERRDGGLTGYFEYASALLSQHTIIRARAAFERALEEVAIYVDQPLSGIASRIWPASEER